MSVFWYTGNTGAGKTSAVKRMQLCMPSSIVLDGDECREIWPGLSLKPSGRIEQNLRVARLAKKLSDQGFTVLVAVICPYKVLRKQVKEICDCEFIYVAGGAESTEETPYEIPSPDEYMQMMTPLEMAV